MVSHILKNMSAPELEIDVTSPIAPMPILISYFASSDCFIELLQYIINDYSAQFIAGGNLVSINKNTHTTSDMISAACFIPYNTNVMPMIKYIIKAEPFPFTIRQQRIYFKCIILKWTKATKPCYNKVCKCAMIVISTSFLIAFQPISSCFIKIFTDIWFTTIVLTLHVFLKLREICFVPRVRVITIFIYYRKMRVIV